MSTPHNDSADQYAEYGSHPLPEPRPRTEVERQADPARVSLGDIPGRPSTTEVVQHLTGESEGGDVDLEPGEGGDVVEVVHSESGVIYLGTNAYCQRVTLAIPMELLKGLAEAWAAETSGADAPAGATDVDAAVRDLFDGQDGELQLLSQLGIRP